jgi:hypothetical protein
MAVILDQRARREITRRRSQGRDASITVSFAPLRGMQEMVSAAWTKQRDRRRGLAEETVDDTTVYLSRRLARYARWRDITISAMRWGPFVQLTVADEPLLVLELHDWEQLHTEENGTAQVL